MQVDSARVLPEFFLYGGVERPDVRDTAVALPPLAEQARVVAR